MLKSDHPLKSCKHIKKSTLGDTVAGCAIVNSRYALLCFSPAVNFFIHIDRETGVNKVGKGKSIFLKKCTYICRMSNLKKNLYFVNAMAISRFHFMKWADSCVFHVYDNTFLTMNST